MPRPQAGTPTDVALTDVDTGIRLGIEAHSVLTSGRSVKHGSGDAYGQRARGREADAFRDLRATGAPR